ncbi:MAG: TolC family protein [Bacteroidetes bacterium]|nr:TolC family protein [Bacteroidota bacterium]MDA0889383.1 TolC family protein [Bacteroidota bacterium]MDA1085304.1 TolC family protein [Bacteroidota bacterium]
MTKLHIILLLICAPFLPAQELDLESAIQLAKTNNRTLQNSSKDIQIAKQKRWETIAVGLPQVSLSAGYINALKQATTVVPSETFGGQPGDFIELLFGTTQSANAGLRLEQLLFDGSYLVGLQASEVYLRISEQAYTKTEQVITQATVDAYINVLLATAQINVLEQNLGAAQQNLNETKAIFENGLTEEENMQQLQLIVSSLQTSLTYTKQMAALAKNVLRYVLGMEFDAPLSLSSTLESLALQYQSENSNALTLSNNIDYQMAQNDIRSKELLLKLERFKSLPRISAFLSGGYDGYNQSFEFTQPDQNWFGRASVGLNLSLPIFSSFQSDAKRQQAKLALEQSKNQAADVAQELLLEESRLRSEVQFNLENLQTTASNLALATSIEQKNQIKFKEGLVSSFTLRQAQTQLYDAQNNYLTAMQQLVVSKTSLSLLLNPVTLNK